MISVRSWLAALAGAALLTIPAGASKASNGSLTSFHFTNVQVSRDSYIAHSEPSLVENPANPQNLVSGSKFFKTAADRTHYRFKIGTYYTTDGGHVWHDSGLLPGFDQFFRVSDVSFAFSPNGSLVYAAVLAQSQNQQVSGIYVARSRDGGKTWSDPTTVFADPTGATFSDKPWIAVDGTNGPFRGRVYVAWNLDSNSASFRWRDPDAGDSAPAARLRALISGSQTDSSSQAPGLMVATSSDYGKSFNAPVVVSGFDNTHFALGAIPQVGPSGALYVAFLRYTATSIDTIEGMALVESEDGGVTFSKPRTIVQRIVPLPTHLPHSNFRNVSLPTFAVSPRDGAMVLSWGDMRFGDADILAVRSGDGGATWTKPIRVNHDAVHDGKDQIMPALAVAPNGVFTAAWFDRRLDPNDHMIDEYIAQSASDGKTFGRNFRVTRKSWDPKIDAPFSEGDPKNTFIGDYQALAVDNLVVHPLWNDTQNGKTQEIRSAVITEAAFSG